MSEHILSQPRIAEAANMGVTATLFSIAIITYATRTYIRARILKKLLADDIILLFAVICLIAVTGLYFASLQHRYDLLAVIFNGVDPTLLLGVVNDILRTIKEEEALNTINWFVIFQVKLAFLFFFRRLVYRVRDLRIWWYFVVVFTLLAGLVSLAASWFTCPYTNIYGIIICSGPDATYTVLRDTAIAVAMDIASDILLISIPIMLLSRVHLKLRQKIGLGLSLCLFLVMAIVPVIKITGIKLNGDVADNVWGCFWQQQECNIAVIMVSMSAFRSYFVATSSNNSPARHEVSRLWRFKLARKYWNMDDLPKSNTHNLPQIPSATLTGMRTDIAGAGAETTEWSDRHEPSEFPLEP